MIKRGEMLDQRHVSKQPCFGTNNTAQKRYLKNVKKVTGPTINHQDYGEIFLMRPNEDIGTPDNFHEMKTVS